jgi:prepilin-type N-terminal cleavage/methylation domain-containing protein
LKGMTRRRSDFQMGFSLLELLVVLMVSALLLTLLSQVLGTMMQASRSAISGSARYEEKLLAERVLTQLIKSMLVLKVDGQKRGLVGSAEGMEFFASPPESLAHLGLVKVRVFGEQQQGRHQVLMLEIEPISERGMGSKIRRHAPLRKRLLEDVTAVTVSYIPGEGDRRELRAWPNLISLPTLVKLSVRQAGEVLSFDILARPRRELGGDCEFSALSLECH